MILVSGFNVYPNEIEAVVYGHPDIIECAAIGVPNEATGEAIKLFVVSRNKQLSADEIMSLAKTPRLENTVRNSCSTRDGTSMDAGKNEQMGSERDTRGRD